MLIQQCSSSLWRANSSNMDLFLNSASSNRLLQLMLSRGSTPAGIGLEWFILSVGASRLPAIRVGQVASGSATMLEPCSVTRATAGTMTSSSALLSILPWTGCLALKTSTCRSTLLGGDSSMDTMHRREGELYATVGGATVVAQSIRSSSLCL